MAAELILQDGTITAVYPKGNEGFTSEELHDLVDGYIEIVKLGDNFMVINEEGKYRNDFTVNQLATDRVAKYMPWFEGNGRTRAQILEKFSNWDTVNGPALFLTGTDAIWLDGKKPPKNYVESEPNWEPKQGEVQQGWTLDELEAFGFVFGMGEEE